MSSKASLSASDGHTTLRGGVGQRTWVSKTAKEAMLLFARAGAVVTVVLYWAGRDSADAREALLVPLAVFWTVVAVTLIWTIDLFFRAVRGHFNMR